MSQRYISNLLNFTRVLLSVHVRVCAELKDTHKHNGQRYFRAILLSTCTCICSLTVLVLSNPNLFPSPLQIFF